MAMKATTRQADETICFACGAVVKRDAGFCPDCGKAIAVEPATIVHQTPVVYSPPSASTTDSEDVIGAGRYILNFILAGLIGLALSYFLRNHGWLATWICIPIFLLVLYVSATTAASGSVP